MNKDIMRKIGKIVLSVLLTILVILGYGVVELDNAGSRLIISTDGEKNPLSSGTEIRITEIAIGKEPIRLDDYVNGDGIKYEDGQLILFPDSNGRSIQIPRSKVEDISITFIKHQWSGKVKINFGEDEIEEDLYSMQEGDSYVYKYIADVDGILRQYLCDKLTTIAGWIMLIVIGGIIYLILWILSILYNKLKSAEIKWYWIPLMVVLIFALSVPYIYVLLIISKKILIISMICILLGVIYDCRLSIKERLDKIFLVIAVLVGVWMLLILPPGHVPDEATHFINSYQKAQLVGNDNIVYREEDGQECIKLPESYYKFIGKYDYDIHSGDYTLTAISCIKDWTKPINKEEIVDYLYWFGNTAKLNVLAYIPSIIIIAILQVFNAPFIGLFLGARLINFIVWLILCYYALKLTPKFKRIFMVIMLMPVSIHQAIGNNQDYLTNAIVFLLAALILRQVYEDENKLISKREILSILGLQILLAYCKLGYFPIAFLAVLIPSKRFKNKRQLVLGKGFMVTACMIFTLVQMNKVGKSVKEGDLYTVSFILKNPLTTAKIYWNTFVQRGILDMLTGLVNGFGWSTKWHIEIIERFMTIAYAILILGNSEKDLAYDVRNKVVSKGVIFMVAFCIMGLIYTALLTEWTRLGNATVEGLQSRYFIPANLLMYMGMNNKVISINSQFKNHIYISILSIGMILSFYTLVSSYYMV